MQTKDEMARELRSLASLSEWTREAPKRPPMRLSNYLRRAGGLRDYGGEVQALMGNQNYRGFGLISKHGLKLDDAGLEAWEAGFIGTPERPTISEFLDYLDRDLAGDHVYSANDWERLAAYESGEDARIELDRRGLLADSEAKQKRIERALLAAADKLEGHGNE